jgi:uncharacterized membrane protein YbhN (UPF0104 family)
MTPAYRPSSMTTTADPAAQPVAAKRRHASLIRRLVLLGVTGVSLYIVFPTLLEVVGSAPQLRDIEPGWFAAMALLQAGSVACMVLLQCIAFRVRTWLPVLTSQLAGAAFGRVVPGGAAAAATMQFGMLVRAGVPSASVASGLTAASLLTFSGLLGMPLLALPGVIAGTVVPPGLARVLWLGLGLFVLLGGAGAALLSHERAVRLVGRALQRARNRVLRRRPPAADLPDRLADERRLILTVLGDRWWEAALATVGKWVLDFLTLVAALAAVGARPTPSLILLAYCASQLLGQIPITPGGLGFVEAGLTGTLALAGVSAQDAVLATLLYRLFAYWLYLPAGMSAALVHARRFGREAAPAP